MEILSKFVGNYNDNRKVAILATGGGVHLGLLAGVPGASKVLHSFYCPYATEESLRFLHENLGEVDLEFTKSAVSEGAARELYAAMQRKYPDCRIIVVTAALSSRTWRRGLNRALVAFEPLTGGEMNLVRIDIPKLSELEHAQMKPGALSFLRTLEDQELTEKVLNLVMGQ